MGTARWLPGELIADRYEVLSVRGGGQARLVEALDRRHDRRVALKVRPAPEGEDRLQLLAEARALLGLPPHPHLPVAREDFFVGGDFVLAIDWVDGEDLETRLAAHGALEPASVLMAAAQVADALDCLHRLEPPLVHGDVKPANVMIAAPGRAVLIDLGLVEPGARSGTTGFMAPEVAAGSRPGPAADVFGLAALLLTLLSGRSPLEGLPSSLPGLSDQKSKAVIEAIRPGLASDPSRRPHSASALVNAVIDAFGVDLPEGVATFLFTDVEGSTRLWESQALAMERVMAEHDQLAAAAVAGHGGRLLKAKGEGDSTVSVFVNPADGVAAALDLQRALSNLASPAGGPLRVRMALHTGPAELRDGDYFGPTLNRAARLRGLAHGGQILLSDATAGMVSSYLPDGVGLADLGQHQLRDLARSERVHQLTHPELMSEFPSLSPGVRTLTNLPSLPTSFIGRNTEVTRVQELLGLSRLVTLTGAGGSGKTRLAQEAGRRALGDYPDGVWLAELAPVGDPSLVPAAVGSAFGLKADEAATADGVVSALAERRALLVLDNCEHVVEAAARLAHAVLAGCPGVRVLATSRERLKVEGEAVWAVPTLVLPLPGENPLDSEAVSLFCARAAAALPGFTLDPSNQAAVVEICRQLDGIPLAIELAAARVRMMQPRELTRRLSGRLGTLSGGARTSLARHQSVRATIEWSYSMLTEPEAVCFRRLGVFRGGFTLDAAEAVTADGDLDVLETLSGLVDKSLVLAEDTPLGTRYRMLETLREFAQERLAAANEEDTYRRRHASVCLQTTLTLVHNFLTNRDQLASLTLADAEFDNVREAIAWSIINDHELGGLLVGSTFEYAMVRANRVEVQEWSRALLAHFDDMSVPARASFGACAGNMIAYAGDVDTGLDLLEAALAAAREGGDARSLINALTGTALVKRLFRNDLATAEELLREAVQVADEFEVTLHRAHARVLLSWTVPEDDEARRLLEEGMELARVTGNRYSEMEALATYASHLPPDAETEGRLRRSLQLCRMFGEVQLTLEVRQQLAVFDASRSGDGDRLTEELTELAEEARKLGHPRLAANASRSVANAHRRAGRFDEARRWLATARGGHPAPVALVSALIQRDEGDPAGAGRDLRRSLRAAVDEIGGPLPSQTPDVLVDMTAVEAADPSADPRATAVMYWSGRAALETGTEWDGLKSFADWEETLQLLSSRLSTEEMAAAEAEGRSRDPAELWDWWLDHRLPQD